jgi:SDR family mycofactocin-dependent oxidoreductase
VSEPGGEAPRVALVTGAARGIGAATVAALSSQGWHVVAVDRGADDPRLPYPLGTVEELEALRSPTVLPFVADVCDPEVLVAAVAEAERVFGGLDVAIAVAGVVAGGVPLWEQPPEQVEAVLDVNLRGVVHLARAAVPALLRRPVPRQGRLLVVASAAAVRGLPLLAAYCAAKAGTTGLVRALAVELAGTGITVNAVSPGSTDTAVLTESARLYGLPSAESFARQQPLDRLVQPEEVAAALLWLAGPHAAAVTGAVLPVDGGLAL